MIMISGSRNYGFSVLQQTSSALLQGGRHVASIQSLASLSRLNTSKSITSSTIGDSMITQLASEIKSADSAESLLKEVYQQVKTSRETLPSVASEDRNAHWSDLKDKLSSTSEELAQLESQAKTSSSSKRLHSIVSQGVSEAYKAVEIAQSQSEVRSIVTLQQGENRVLSAISKVSQFSNQLEKASLKVLNIQDAYAGASVFNNLQSASSGISFQNNELIQQKAGILLDILS
jgi:hypothetical protein